MALYPARVLILLPALLCTALTARGGDWVTSLGGRSDRSGLSTEKGPAAPTVLWVGNGTALLGLQGVTEGNRLFLTRIEPSPDLPSSTWLVARHLDTGAELWKRQLPIDFHNSWINHVSGARDGQLYATRAQALSPEYLYALDTVDGSILWRSQDLVEEDGSQSVAFTDDGDLVTADRFFLLRISRANGRTVWRTPRRCDGTGSCSAAVVGNKAYAFEDVHPPSTNAELHLTVYDATTGARLYSSATLFSAFAFAFQISPFTAPGNLVYAPLYSPGQISDFVAFQDTGSALVEKWRIPMGARPFASFGIGPDGSVHTYSPLNEILKINAAGTIVARSSPIVVTDPSYLQRLAVDAGGTVFFTLSSASSSAVYCFDSTFLGTLWTDAVAAGLGYGPLLGSNGTLAVLTAGSDVKTYRGSPFPTSPLNVDPRPGVASNGNAVLEPGETVSLEPTWKNISTSASLTGSASSFLGPPGATYTLLDAAAAYGTVATNQAANCFSATGNCYSLSVSNPATRPTLHWDAAITETVAGSSRRFVLHVGRSFSDVPTTSNFYRFIETILHNGITAGCSATAFCPDSPVTRAQMAVFLMRGKHGSTWTPTPATGTVFLDVPVNAFAAAWIERLPVEGISAGCGGGNYCPNDAVLRKQMAVFLLRAEHGMSYTPPPATGVFSDVPRTDPFAPWIEQLAAEGITAGCGGGRYCPLDSVTRGQMAVFLTTTFKLPLYAP